MDEIRTGDLVMSGPVNWGKASWRQRGILLTGSKHTHDEIVIETEMGLMLGDAEPPCFSLRPFTEEVEACTRGDSIMAVFRWHEFVELQNADCGLRIDPSTKAQGDFETKSEGSEIGNRKSAMLRFQDGVEAGVRLLAELKVPYDEKGIESHALNYLRSLMPFRLPFVGDHVEYEVYCTEGVFAVYKVNGIDLNEILGNQPLPAPIHTERLFKQGCFVPVADYGLIEKLKEGV